MHGVLWACLALTSCWNGAISFQVSAGEPKVSTSDLTLSQGEERSRARTTQPAANGRQDQTGKRVASNSMYGRMGTQLSYYHHWIYANAMANANGRALLCTVQAGRMGAAQDSFWLGLQQPSADVSSLPGGDRRRSRQRLFP